MEEKQEITLEEAFAQLDEIIEAMQGRELTLEQAFASYERGMKLVKLCSGKVDLVEKQVMMLSEEGEEIAF